MSLNFEPGAQLPPVPLVLPAVLSDASIGDWSDMLGAVSARLQLIVDGCFVHAPGGGCGVQAHVLECVSALDLLQTSLTQVLGQRQHLELAVLDSQTALAHAHAELLGTQADGRRERYLALHDSLTSLPNRRYFRERLDRALALPSNALALLYIDIDGFKAINDNHGHHAGDELLKIVSARLARAIRNEDVVARLGGDEFACLLGGLVNREHLERLAEKLFDAVSAPFKIGALTLAVRPSIGIAICPGDGATADLLLRNADVAMYRAKLRRTGHAFFDECTAPSWIDTEIETLPGSL